MWFNACGCVLSHVAPPPRQCVLTLRESDSTASDAIACSFCFCCWNNQSFSACTIEDIQLQLSIVPSNESKNYFKVLMELLVGLSCCVQVGPSGDDVSSCLVVDRGLLTAKENQLRHHRGKIQTTHLNTT